MKILSNSKCHALRLKIYLVHLFKAVVQAKTQSLKIRTLILVITHTPVLVNVCLKSLF